MKPVAATWAVQAELSTKLQSPGDTRQVVLEFEDFEGHAGQFQELRFQAATRFIHVKCPFWGAGCEAGRSYQIFPLCKLARPWSSKIEIMQLSRQTPESGIVFGSGSPYVRQPGCCRLYIRKAADVARSHLKEFEASRGASRTLQNRVSVRSL